MWSTDMIWPFVVIGFLFLGLMFFVIKLHRDFIRIRDAADAALDDLEGLNG